MLFLGCSESGSGSAQQQGDTQELANAADASTEAHTVTSEQGEFDASIGPTDEIDAGSTVPTEAGADSFSSASDDPQQTVSDRVASDDQETATTPPSSVDTEVTDHASENEALTEPEGVTAPACQCDSGPCCDGCLHLAKGFRCSTHDVASTTCSDGSFYSAAICNGRAERIVTKYQGTRCSGESAECDGEVAEEETTSSPCTSQGPPYSYCAETIAGQAECVPCQTEAP